MSDTPAQGPPAGWYPDPHGGVAGQQRWWDGEAWSEQVQLPPPAAGTAADAAPPSGQGAPPPPGQGAGGEAGPPGGLPGRPWYKKKRFVIPIGIVVLLFVLPGLGGQGEDEGTTLSERDAADEEADAAPTDPEEPPEEHTGQDAEGAAEEEAEEEADAEEAADDDPLGSRESPLPLGTFVDLGDWSVSVIDVDLDATETVRAANQFNDPPEDGEQFVLFTVEAVYEGSESGDPMFDFRWAIVGSEGNTFRDSCGVISDRLRDQGETFPDGEVVGNVCYRVASDQLDGATIGLDQLFSFRDDRVFFALE